MSQPDGRNSNFPADWHPVDDREILAAMIAEVRNALIPAMYHIGRIVPDNCVDRMEIVRVQVQRVLDFTDICRNKMK